MSGARDASVEPVGPAEPVDLSESTDTVDPAPNRPDNIDDFKDSGDACDGSEDANDSDQSDSPDDSDDSEESVYVPFLSWKDSVSDVYVPPPLTKDSETALQSKIPLLQKIEAIYSSIVVPVGSESRSWCRLGMGWKKMTWWMYGLLYSMSDDSLMRLSQDPKLIETVCDSAKEFLLLCSGHVSIRYRHYRDKPLMSWDAIHSRHTLHDGERGEAVCAISGKRHALCKTYIMPFDTNSSPGSTRLLQQLFGVPEILFGPTFTARARELLASRVGNSHTKWNIITLNLYLGRLFDDGYLALRPIALKSSNTKGREEHTVYFSVHWLFENEVVANHYISSPRKADIKSMLRTDTVFNKQRSGICETNTVTGEKILDNQVFSIAHRDHRQAENMYIMLAFRWAVSLALCLAGGVGMWEVDAETDSESDFGRSGKYDIDETRKRKG
ncbi:hypothetical protein A9K55_009187 [Cordyceps militaris]|uniref:Uncharacterized protein n=1 Tax=Cordyceps militaris TaxID=73501 RepID=A0A2H4SID3_CORMI|nr:hypothetical protein A9K55_009187 [Cordyceps militaris]